MTRPAPAAHGNDNTPTRLKLLIVDDDVTQRRLIARAGAQAGHAVTTATSIRGALEKIREEEFDCVTLDLMLEDGIGTEVLTAMAEANFGGKVILISGTGARQRIAARKHARTLGIELRSLPKPLDLSALRVCLADVASSARGLPATHMWGGIQVGLEYEQYRTRLS